MPVMDGFEVLVQMNRNHWIEDIPVVMISSDDTASNIKRAYNMGVSDYIRRPFDAQIVFRRVVNTIKLYAKQRRLITLVTDQIDEKEKNNQIMIRILSQIVEFRNGESGLHVEHINILTGLLLERLVQKTDHYDLTWSDQYRITLASALHDIGKIGIDDKILNKTGRLTKEEFEIMKSHTLIGASILDGNDGKINGGTLSIPNTSASLSGDFKVYAASAFTPNTSSKLTIHVYLHVGNTLVGQSEVVFDKMTGRFDPDIAPNIESINIKENLPDFLDSDDVTIQVANPTIKFMADLSNVPASIEFNAGLKANKKDGTVAASIKLPGTGNATLVKEKKNHIYFYEDAAAGPYSPEAIEATAMKYQVDNISSLITKLPDNISVDLKENRRVKLVDEDVTIQLGRTYNSAMTYESVIYKL